MNQIIAVDTSVLQAKLQILERDKQIAQLEKQVEELKQQNPLPSKSKKPKDRVREYNEYKSDGVRKATPAQAIESYDDFKKISDWFWDHQEYRNWALWWCGIAFGLRFSDLAALKWKQIFDRNGNFRDRIKTIERKTGKLQSCIITEAVRYAIQRYVLATQNPCLPDDHIFPPATKGKGDGTHPLTTSQGNKILKAAAHGCQVSFHMSTHTLRKSMTDIAGCLCETQIDTTKFTMLQGMLNHSNINTTMKYMGFMDKVYDIGREAVSDFLMGKTGINKLELNALQTNTQKAG